MWYSAIIWGPIVVWYCTQAIFKYIWNGQIIDLDPSILTQLRLPEVWKLPWQRTLSRDPDSLEFVFNLLKVESQFFPDRSKNRFGLAISSHRHSKSRGQGTLHLRIHWPTRSPPGEPQRSPRLCYQAPPRYCQGRCVRLARRNPCCCGSHQCSGCNWHWQNWHQNFSFWQLPM